MKKAELEQRVQELEAQLNKRKETMTNSKKAEATATTNAKFNVFENTYRTLVKAYLTSEDKTSFEIIVKHYNDRHFTNKEGVEVKIEGSEKVLRFLNKNNVLKIKSFTPDIVEGKQVYRIQIVDFDIKAKLQGKFGEYSPFAKALGRLMTA